MNIDRTITRCFKESYFPDVWYAIENSLAVCKGKKVLELGSGRGLFSVALKRSGWDFTCVDSLQSCVNMTNLNLKDKGFEPQCQLIKPRTLPFESNTFDAIVCSNFIEFEKSPSLILEEICRVLKPESQLILVTFTPLTPWTIGIVRKFFRPGDRGSIFKPYREVDIRALISQTDLKIEKTKPLIKYSPIQLADKPLGWFKPSVIASYCVKTNPIHALGGIT